MFWLLIAEDQILTEMDNMLDYGYDFRNEPFWNFQSKSPSNLDHIKRMKRKVYVRNVCQNCRDKDNRPNVWTSILGVAQINFIVVDLEQFFIDNPKLKSENKSPYQEAKNKNYPLCIMWNLNIYRMKCKKCDQWGQTYIYQKQLQGLAKSFCFIIAEIMEDIKPPSQKDNRYKIIEVHKHEESLCQACLNGECFNIQKGQQGKSYQ